MNKLFYFLMLLFTGAAMKAKAQSVGIGTNAPHPSALLDLQSSTKGFLIPGMTTSARLTIASPAPGLLVYDNTSKSIWIYSSGFWQSMVTSSSSQWSNSGVDIYNNSNRVGIGTITPHPNALLDLKSNDKGLLIPRGNAVTRASLNSNTAKGLLVCDTTTNTIWIHNGNGLATGWQSLSTGTNYWQLEGAAGTELQNMNRGGFWSANPTTVNSAPSSFVTPVNGAGTRLMWMPAKNAFRAGTVYDDSFTPLEDESAYFNSDSIGLGSFATGKNTKALGGYSVAMGYQAKAEGDASVAIGSYLGVYGHGSVAFGQGSSVSGNRAFSAGWNNRVDGHYSVAFGNRSYALADNSFVIGSYSTAEGVNSLAGGGGCYSSGSASVALGGNSIALGNYVFAMGNNTQANGDACVCLGDGTTGKSYASLTLGQYNDSIASSNKSDWIVTDPLIILGNGTSHYARHNALVVYKNGNTDHNGFTRLGESSDGAPRIKTKKISGYTTPTVAAPNSWTFVPHGITNPDKILSISVIVTSGSYQFLPNSPDAPYVFTVNTDPTGGGVGQSIAIGVKSSVLSSGVMGKPIKIFITYEE